jgi:predicted transposase YbfD/YdcC
MVSVFAGASGGCAAVKLRQIVAIPKRFAVMEIEGVIVTLDAMGCQRGGASKSRFMNQKADYVCAQRQSRHARASRFSRPRTKRMASKTQSQSDHGRIVTRADTAIHHASPHATFSNTI